MNRRSQPSQKPQPCQGQPWSIGDDHSRWLQQSQSAPVRVGVGWVWSQVIAARAAGAGRSKGQRGGLGVGVCLKHAPHGPFEIRRKDVPAY